MLDCHIEYHPTCLSFTSLVMGSSIVPEEWNIIKIYDILKIEDWNRIQIDDSLWMPKWSCRFISYLLSCCCKRSHLEKAATRIPGCVLWMETAFVFSHATERAAWLFTARLELPISSAKFIGERRATSTNMELFPVQHPVRRSVPDQMLLADLDPTPNMNWGVQTNMVCIPRLGILLVGHPAKWLTHSCWQPTVQSFSNGMAEGYS